jgi:3'(2'), 5'-bisphosphate nucleotidase
MREAGAAIMSYYGCESYDTILKTDKTPVTAADLKANNIITQQLLDLYPDIPVISEEAELPPYTQREKYLYLWLLDPLDGTKEFINRTDEFSINLALICRDCPVAGFIYIPVSKKFYYAIKGQGAYEVINDIKVNLQSSTFSLSQKGLRVVISRNSMDVQTYKYIDALDHPILIKLGSALKFISIAKGKSDYYPRMINIMEWDTAAGQIIIEEAGGALLDAETGVPLKYNKPSMINPFFIARGNLETA